MGTEACKKGHVKINDKTVKPSREVYPMDEVKVRKNQIWYEFTVLDIPESRVGAKLVAIYRKDTCLLYTSPSPRDLSTSRMPSSA